MKVAALQMVSATSVAANLAVARQLLERAATQGAELAVLPEYFCVMGLKDTDKLAVQEAAGEGPIQDFLASSARELGLWIVGGTVPLRSNDRLRVRNSSLAYAPSGQCVARYDKIHLFRFDNGVEQYDESRVIEGGATPVTFDIASIDGHHYRVGLSVCYDLRFPELYRARAIENLAYVVAAAQGGTHENGRNTWGQSLVVDPWGEVIAQQAQGPGVVMAELSVDRLRAVRLQLPALAHGVL
jgi:predicted amidohydrolase